ncbi:hypothetical protein KBD81_00355 [Candidatus Woesebacteria bacterium]|nr:hypothetical protein [Candidatus Woesebacteria bacterium]
MIYLFLFLLPIQLGTFFFIPESYINGIRIDYLAPAIYLTDLIAFALILFNIKKLLSILLSNIKKIPVLLLILGVILNVSFAIEPLIALYRVVKILEVLAIFMIIKEWKANSLHVLLAFLMGAAVQLGLMIFQVTQGHSMQGLAYFLGERAFSLSTPAIAKVSLQGIEILRGYGTFPHPNALAGFYLLLYTFFLYKKPPTILPTNDYRPTTLTPLFLALCTLLILFSFSKISMLGLVLVTSIYVLKEKYECIICGISKMGIPLVLTLLVFATQGDAESLEKRMYLAQSSLIIIKEHLLTGVGMGNYLYAQAAFPIPYKYVFLQPVHNIFLLMVTELGILPMVIGMYYAARNMLSKKFLIPNFSFLIILSVIVCTGMLDHYWLTIQQNILLLPVIFGLLQRHDRVVK